MVGIFTVCLMASSVDKHQATYEIAETVYPGLYKIHDFLSLGSRFINFIYPDLRNFYTVSHIFNCNRFNHDSTFPLLGNPAPDNSIFSFSGEII